MWVYMMTIVIKALAWFMVVVCARCTDVDDLPPCLTTVKKQDLFSYFHMDGKPLKTKGFFTDILEKSEIYCALNTTEMIQSMSLPTYPLEIAIGLRCMHKQQIHLSEYDGAYYKHVLFHVEIVNCTIDLNNINNLIGIADTKVLVIASKINTTSVKSERNSSDALQNVVSLSVENLDKDAPDLFHIFEINETYLHLAEVSLSNISLERIPSNIHEIFPNLQSLELSKNKFTLPPAQFPWIESTVRLPRNISRSPYMQSHYSNSEYVKIQDNIFRRYFTLDDNNITDLQNFSFHGMLHKISLKRNGLNSLGTNTFRTVSGLQNLDISENKLRTLPTGVFSGLVSLHRLDLSSNQLQNLTTGTFDDLHSLKILNLANNSLTSLPEAIFSSLNKLQQIQLNHNKLTDLNPDSFPLSSITLQKLYFHVNPLKALPEFPFWIRSLILADFHSTDITFDNFTEFLENINALKVFHSVIDSASSSDSRDLIERADVLRNFDLTGCNISSLSLEENLPRELERILLVLLLHFRFNLENNPILCDCKINNLAEFIDTHVLNGTIPKDEYYFQNWVCSKPREIAGRKMLKVQAKDTYCEVAVPGCPSECNCYERATVNRVIVDCRNKYLPNIHSKLPNATLELWYNVNNITKLTHLTKPENIHMLDVSVNKIENIQADTFSKMTNLRILRLHSNVLAYLPPDLKNLDLTIVTIWPNPFTCDCNTKWMKTWLETNRNIINESDKVACKIESEEGMLFTEVPDEKFVCHTDSAFDELRYVVLPSIVCSTLVIIVLILAVLFYTYRLECKVLLFVYFGVHPFDKDSSERHENIDCVVVHSGIQTDWVMDKIVSLLENENYHYVVCDMARDFVVGYSLQENLTRTVRYSKRMIFCLSNDWPTSSDNFLVAWRIAQEKIKQTKSHYGIIVTHDVKATEIKDTDLKRFMRRGRFIDSKDKLFRNKIVYYMPQMIRTTPSNSQTMNFRRKSEYISRCFINSYCEDSVQAQETVLSPDSVGIGITANTHAFISYHDNDFQYVLKELLPLLDDKGFSYCIQDRDFVPGASKEENILNAISCCHRTIFILSPSHVIDEWSLFTFRTAYEKSLRDKSNHLLVVIKEEVDKKDLDEEISHYLKNYICLNVNDKWFEKKLFNGLPLLKDKEDLHSSPLFIDRENIPEEFEAFEL